MLRYIYNVDVGILKYYDKVNMITNDCLLTVCCAIRNRDCFMYIFKYLVTSGATYSTNWNKLTPYLLEAIQLYPPHSDLARRILNDFINNNWSEEGEQVVKLLVSLTNLINRDIAITQYSHLAPHLEPLHSSVLYSACADNNVEEVKHRLHYYQPEGGNCYEAITSQIDNKESLALMLPYLTDKTCGNTYIISAYVNNKLPDYTIHKYSDDVTMRAVICHFTGSTNLEGTKWNYSLLAIAYKFNFNTRLLYECVKIAIGHDHNSRTLNTDMRHKVNAITCKIKNSPIPLCLCEFCCELQQY